eukprot:7162012-Alexandrium_andersonii.AAC.1
MSNCMRDHFGQRAAFSNKVAANCREQLPGAFHQQQQDQQQQKQQQKPQTQPKREERGEDRA